MGMWTAPSDFDYASEMMQDGQELFARSVVKQGARGIMLIPRAMTAGMRTMKMTNASTSIATSTTTSKKPTQQPLFDATAEPRAKPETWKLDAPPISLGTLPREVYQAYCVLRAKGPCDAKKLQREISRVYDWDVMRIMRVVTKLASCGYVDMGEGGVLSVRPEP